MPREVNTTETIGERMTTEQLAASAYRVATYAYGKEPLAWGLVAPSEREAWLRVAVGARDDVGGLASLDGLDWDEVAKIVYDVAEGRKSLKENVYPSAPEWRACWQAVSRHLVQLMDEDDIEDLAALEQSWREWASKRLQTLEKP
jgi:hypothetical protein